MDEQTLQQNNFQGSQWDRLRQVYEGQCRTWVQSQGVVLSSALFHMHMEDTALLELEVPGEAPHLVTIRTSGHELDGLVLECRDSTVVVHTPIDLDVPFPAAALQWSRPSGNYGIVVTFMPGGLPVLGPQVMVRYTYFQSS